MLNVEKEATKSKELENLLFTIQTIQDNSEFISQSFFDLITNYLGSEFIESDNNETRLNISTSLKMIENLLRTLRNTSSILSISNRIDSTINQGQPSPKYAEMTGEAHLSKLDQYFKTHLKEIESSYEKLISSKIEVIEVYKVSINKLDKKYNDLEKKYKALQKKYSKIKPQ